VARTQIIGLNETLGALKQIDPEIDKQQRQRVRRDIQPLVDDAKKATPKQTPLSGWKLQTGAGIQRGGGESRFPRWKGDAQRGIRTQIRRGGVRGFKGKRVVIRVVQGSASGEIFDYAGKARPGNPIDRGLRNAGFGEAMRALWPAAEKNMPVVVKHVQESVFDMEEVINAELKLRGYSGRRLRAAQRRAFGR
jgi:hypothetical protein